MEEVTSKPFPVILDEAILAELELPDTDFLTHHNKIAIANRYDESLLHLGRQNLTGFRRSWESGATTAGGMLSTSRDVAHSVHALFNGKVLSDPSLAAMETLNINPAKYGEISCTRS